MREKILFGNSLQSTMQFETGRELFSLIGADGNGKTLCWPISEEMMSKHMLLLGAIGMGKSNAMQHLVRNVRNTMSQNDVMLIFDTKGDYYREFYQQGDIVISNDDRATGGSEPNYWNLFEEVMINDNWEENAAEVAKTIFAERLEKTTQVFFPNAAKDLLTALILCMCRSREPKEKKNNNSLIRILHSLDSEKMVSFLRFHPDLEGMISYIRDAGSGQTLGVISELQSAVREILIGNFMKSGSLSMRNLIRKKGGKAIFVEYDLGIGGVLSPVYRLLFDLAIKEALCRDKHEGNVYFIMDEFSLLPNLQHIDDGVNFGRSLGARFIACAQNVSQVYDAYGRDRANSLLSGFSTTICFRLNDAESREFFKELNGKNGRVTSFNAAVQGRGQIEQYREAFVVEDHDIDSLKVGEAIIHSGAYSPFRFRFGRFDERDTTEKTPFVADEKIRCPKCSRIVGKSNRFCIFCGNRFPDKR